MASTVFADLIITLVQVGVISFLLIRRGAVICGNLLLIWKQWIIWLTSPLQRLRVSDFYSPGRSYDGVVGSPGSDCQLLPRSPDNTPGSGKTKSHPAKHSFNTLIKTIAEFTKWLHFLLQDMEVIIWPSVLHTLHRGPCNAHGMSSDGGACQEFGFQLKRILNGKRAKLPPKVEWERDAPGPDLDLPCHKNSCNLSHIFSNCTDTKKCSLVIV